MESLERKLDAIYDRVERMSNTFVSGSDIMVKIDLMQSNIAHDVARLKVMEQKLDEALDRLKEHEGLLRGTKENSYRGLSDEVQRLGHNDERRAKHIFAVWVGLIGAGFALVAEAIGKMWHG